MRKIIAFGAIVWACIDIASRVGVNGTVIAVPAVNASVSFGAVIGAVLAFWVTSKMK